MLSRSEEFTERLGRFGANQHSSEPAAVWAKAPGSNDVDYKGKLPPK